MGTRASLGKRYSGDHSILRLATAILGSEAEAVRWLEAPAMALDQRRPIDLVETRDGEALVTTLLNRIDYGVYT